MKYTIEIDGKDFWEIMSVLRNQAENAEIDAEQFINYEELYKPLMHISHMYKNIRIRLYKSYVNFTLTPERKDEE